MTMIGGGGLQLAEPPTSASFRHYPHSVCTLTKQGQRFLSSLAAAEEPSAAASLLRKFAASSSKHVALTTLSHLLSPSNSHPRLSSLAFPLYTAIKQESWFSWNAKLVADVIAFLYKKEMFNEAETLFAETVLKLGFKERDLCTFYCNLVDFNAKHKSERGFMDSCSELRKLITQSSSVYTKQRGYSAMVAGFCEMGYPEKAENMVEQMAENGVRPSAFELRGLIYGYGQKGLIEDMKRIVVYMENEGLGLDTVCCNMVLSSFGVQGEIHEMVSWLRKMRELGIDLSVRTYNSVLNSCPTIVFMLKDMNSLPLSIDELVDNLRRDETSLVMELMKSNILNQVMECSPSELKLDLHGMHLSTVYLVLLHWFHKLKLRFDDEDWTAPAEILVVSGRGRHSYARGESPCIYALSLASCNSNSIVGKHGVQTPLFVSPPKLLQHVRMPSWNSISKTTSISISISINLQELIKWCRSCSKNKIVIKLDQWEKVFLLNQDPQFHSQDCQDKSQNQGIHHIYIFPRFLRETASEIRRRACPSTARGKEGAAPTPTTTP